jgi:hypothetical protein
MSAIGQQDATEGSLSAAECLAKAEDLEELADRLPYPHLAEGYRLIAEAYRVLAAMEMRLRRN